ncbi:unnamed protein product [Schistosoma mansoni]|uniref:Smp_206180 n=1 Tax=Schistosoma mansoni TaxID=6183 RepID=UPI00022C873E|nr:unnamed protein product [Schistosoma mansoni]|eukprot:XP_018647456.1 unnamed protein product [Schistosoma mansoni]
MVNLKTLEIELLLGPKRPSSDSRWYNFSRLTNSTIKLLQSPENSVFDNNFYEH